MNLYTVALNSIEVSVLISSMLFVSFIRYSIKFVVEFRKLCNNLLIFAYVRMVSVA